MNSEPLRSWLSLPPGPWPPDDRTLLGLGGGPLTVEAVEQSALAQMEKLRPHQLVSAELVTEGMNRLAQALIALTEEAKRLARPAKAEPVLDGGTIDRPPDPPIVLEAEVVSVPLLLEPAAKPRKPSRKAKGRKKQPARPRTSSDPAVDVPDAEVVPPGSTYSPAERRKGYRQLAGLRRVLRAWERLRPYFGAPSEPVDTPGVVFGFVDAVYDCRRVVAVDGEREWFAEQGRRILAIVQHPLPLAVFRDLVFQQRQDVAAEWATVTARLRGRYQGLRQEMQQSKPKKAWNAPAKRVVYWLKGNPEWVLGLFVVIAVAVAFVRAIGSRS